MRRKRRPQPGGRYMLSVQGENRGISIAKTSSAGTIKTYYLHTGEI